MRIKSKLREYEVTFFNTIDSLIDTKKYDSNLLWIVDNNVYELYPRYFNNPILFDAFESNKTLEYASKFIEVLNNKKIKLDTTLVIVGGGITQDVMSFVASIYGRGLDYILIPTTLLAQCDSCIGGKTGLNFEKTKNLLGTFYPPKEVLICPQFLNTLSEKDYNSGMGEIIKFYILHGIYSINTSNIKSLIEFGLTYKSNLINDDEFDKGNRKLLNYGHTIGHALEATSNYQIPHGTAVLIGILIENRAAYKLGQGETLSKNVEDQISNMIKPWISYMKYDPRWFDPIDIVNFAMSDKKNSGKGITFVRKKDKGVNLDSTEKIFIFTESINEIYNEL